MKIRPRARGSAFADTKGRKRVAGDLTNVCVESVRLGRQEDSQASDVLRDSKHVNMDAHVRGSTIRVGACLLGLICRLSLGIKLRVIGLCVHVFLARFNGMIFGDGTAMGKEFAFTRRVCVKTIGGLCPRGAVFCAFTIRE